MRCYANAPPKIVPPHRKKRTYGQRCKCGGALKEVSLTVLQLTSLINGTLTAR